MIEADDALNQTSLFCHDWFVMTASNEISLRGAT